MFASNSHYHRGKEPHRVTTKISTYFLILTLLQLSICSGFTTGTGAAFSTPNIFGITVPKSTQQPILSSLSLSSNINIPDEKSIAETVLKQIHESGYPFRVIVIGNGAILESTSILGPNFSKSKSPKTGEELITLSTVDKSFEFHVKIGQVYNVKFVSMVKPEGKVLRICRFMNADGSSAICSLILGDSSESAVKWFDDMMTQYS